MKADYTSIVHRDAVPYDGDNRQMKADYTLSAARSPVTLRWRQPPNEGGLHPADFGSAPLLGWRQPPNEGGLHPGAELPDMLRIDGDNRQMKADYTGGE